MTRITQLWDLDYKHADDPDADHKEVGVAKFQIRYFMKTTCPLAKLVRRMEPGDTVVYVSENCLTTTTVKCYAV